MKACVKVTVKGLVQGVGYRYFCHKKAMEYGITGYARNLYNGNVEVVAKGEKGMVTEFVRELKIGPSRSRVSAVDIEECELTAEYNEFSIM